MEDLKSPFNYTGTKQNTLDFLFMHFKKDVPTFIDLFCGGGSVGLTALNFYSDVRMNDIIVPLYNFYLELQTVPFEQLLFNIDAVKVDKTSQESFLALRKWFNETGATNPYMFFALCSACTNNMMRFNNSFLFNQTFGKRTVNEKTLEKLKVYSDKLFQNKKISFTNEQFDENLDNYNASTFVYLDPPYIQTSAGYNCYWSKDRENALYTFMDKLNIKGVPFAMSNTLYHKGALNPNYDRFKHLNIIEVDTFYNKVAKKDKDKDSVEILVTNY